MATIGITIPAISPADSFLLDVPFVEPVVVEPMLGSEALEDDGSSAG